MSGRDWRGDKARADRFARPLKWILGQVFFRDATTEEDRKESTDTALRIYQNEPRAARIGLRVRDFEGYRPRYAGEFTIRSHRATGARTEWDKVINGGLCDFLLYVWARYDQERIVSYVVIDLDRLRAGIRDGSILRPGDIPNGDGTYFKALSTIEYPDLVFDKSPGFGREIEREAQRAGGRP